MSESTITGNIKISIEMLNFMLEEGDISPEDYNAVIQGKRQEPRLVEIWGTN